MVMSCYYSHCSISFKQQYSTYCAFQLDPICTFKDTILPSEIVKSKGYIKTKKILDNNNWPSGCDHCRIPESNNLKSTRLEYTIEHSDLERVEIRFSNACNMACLHCGPEYSSLWAKKLNYTDEILGLTSEQIIKICEDLKQIPTIRRIVLSGGEPLINKNFYKCVQLLSEHPCASEIRISFHTNLNPGKMIDFDLLETIFQKFKEVYMVVSVDGGEQLYSTFRGGDWNILLNNIKHAHEMNINIDGTMSLTTHQMQDLKNCYLDVLPLGFRELRTLYVSTPDHLNPKYAMSLDKIDDFSFVLNYIKNNYTGTLKSSAIWYLNNCLDRLQKEYYG